MLCTSKLVLSATIVGFVTMLVVGSCMPTGPGYGYNYGGVTAVTGADLTKPYALPPPSHTVDNTGFIDNGGRSSDETGRMVTSGMRVTEMGEQQVTGTPGAGFPIPIEPRAAPAPVGEGAGAASSVTGTPGPTPSGGPSSEAIERIARARCDRLTFCNRVGASREAQDSCLRAERKPVRAEIESAPCTRGIDRIQLQACLVGLRDLACDDNRASIDLVSECRLSALCAPPK